MPRLCPCSLSAFGFPLLLLVGSASAAELNFTVHPVDRRCTLSAAAAIDVNHDGRLDILCGTTWYEAPAWKPHVVRDVEFIRGRYDDYACLPMDVNGDGWTDFIISNYRSQKLGWVEHPGAKLGPWTEHVIERPGPMETGRLVDLDGDGRLDVLPNGRDFIAWWDIALEKSADGKLTPRWTRHDLPREAIGHGIGVGDINGDGRADIVGPQGWLEAPTDRRRGRWIWHADYNIGRDASVPMQVADVDGDGDADIVWGRGHRTGLYWLEQSPGAEPARRWQEHVIDTSWSQAHTVELADLDGDGRPEIVTGKRYLGHDGKDLGEWDPLVIYWYQFDRSNRVWRRGQISGAGQASFDVDPKIVDLDGDGDLDLVAPGRNGLYWCENLLRGAAASASGSPPRLVQARPYPDHSKLLVYLDDRGGEQPVKTPADWARRRADVLANVQTVMGSLPGPERRVDLDVQILEDVPLEKYTRRKITFASEPGDRVPAYLFLPKGLKKPAPAMLCLHPTGPLGKGIVAGLANKPNRAYAAELAERGFVCLAPDYPSFGDYPYDFAAAGRLPSGSMKAIWNNLRAVDLLETLPQVDRDRIGCIGHSLGGHNSLFTVLFDQRIKAVVSSCGFTAFHHYYGGKLAGWTSARYMPRIRSEYANDPNRVPFDFYEIVAALAPRPFFTNSPLHDGNFDVAGVKKVMAAAGEIYALYDARDRLVAEYPDDAHDFPPAQREQSYDWLKKQLKY